MLILTHNDELNTIYGEDNQLPIDTTTSNNKTSCTDTSRTRLESQREQHMRERRAPNPNRSTGAPWQESPGFEETRATIVSSGPSTTTVTSVVPTPESVWFDHSRSFGKGRCSKNNKGKPYRQAEQLGGKKPNQKLSVDEEEKMDREESAEGTSQICTSLEEQRKSMILADPVLNLNKGTVGLKPPSTITTWEAGWNVTNAIQVRILSILHKKTENYINI